MNMDLKKRCVSCLLTLLMMAFAMPLMAQQESTPDQAPFVDSIGSRQKYAATIEMKKGYVSGICVMLSESDGYRASIFNEFGISALDFTYLPSKHKIKLQHVVKMLDKWYIRKILKHDLVHVMDHLQKGISTYTDEKYHIKYQFKILDDSKEINHEKNMNDATEE